MSNGIQGPQTEIVVRFEGREIALIAFFPDEEGGADVVCGMENTGQVDVVAALLQHSAYALRTCFEAVRVASDNGNVSGVSDGESAHPF